jgi:hypothetical protein
MLQLILGGFVVLTIVYGVVRAYARSVEEERLETQFDGGGVPGLRENFIRDGMARYDHSLRKRLILGVYIVPVVLIVIIAVVVNHN